MYSCTVYIKKERDTKTSVFLVDKLTYNTVLKMFFSQVYTGISMDLAA